ncbi:hypothetical protein T12_14118 [Trichinella patagoniensis]|uniref:Uncharacterized protein n=2 Tax=Trichinella TaxID=6333 RepID=A0A0V1AGM2_9BILA|nr:hypothetical protein T05_10376 [Trichinella murrelli]KRY23985.1 hypothetical protein T12_14118 [Trichinella patagoniensis]
MANVIVLQGRGQQGDSSWTTVEKTVQNYLLIGSLAPHFLIATWSASTLSISATRIRCFINQIVTMR